MLEMIWLDDSLVSVIVCHISSSDDAVIIVPVHCDLLQNTPLAASPNIISIQLWCLVTGRDQATSIIIIIMWGRGRDVQSLVTRPVAICQEKILSVRGEFILQDSISVLELGRPQGQAQHSEGCWPVISLVMSHHTSHLTPPATISIFPLTYWRLNRWTLGLQY